MAPYGHPPPGNLPDDLPLPPQLAGRLLRRLEELADDELDHTTLTIAGGDQVQIVCMSEVRAWLTGWAIRAESGERP